MSLCINRGEFIASLVAQMLVALDLARLVVVCAVTFTATSLSRAIPLFQVRYEPSTDCGQWGSQNLPRIRLSRQRINNGGILTFEAKPQGDDEIPANFKHATPQAINESKS